MKKALKIAATIVGVYLLFAGALVVYAIGRNYSGTDDFPPEIITPAVRRTQPQSVQILPTIPNSEIIPHDTGGVLRPPQRTNFLFVGLDNNSLADAIMVGCFYSNTGEIRLMSIPRDTYTRIPQHRLDAMRANGLRPPESLKINAVRAFGGRVHGLPYLQEQLGEMLGVQFHYYLELDLAAFGQIVDAIGGVTMHIPFRLTYSDPCQGLTIDIAEGVQHLCGHAAQQVVRFRSYRTGDLQRNNVQMQFMQALIGQAVTREAITNDPIALASTIFAEVRTNANLLDMAKYLPYITNISHENIQTFTLPGDAEYKNGISWFIPDPERLPATVGEVFYK